MELTIKIFEILWAGGWGAGLGFSLPELRFRYYGIAVSFMFNPSSVDVLDGFKNLNGTDRNRSNITGAVSFYDPGDLNRKNSLSPSFLSRFRLVTSVPLRFLNLLQLYTSKNINGIDRNRVEHDRNLDAVVPFDRNPVLEMTSNCFLLANKNL